MRREIACEAKEAIPTPSAQSQVFKLFKVETLFRFFSYMFKIAQEFLLRYVVRKVINPTERIGRDILLF
jgi:hypothetical protein